MGTSKAGAYLSVPDVDSKDGTAVASAIDRVLATYVRRSDADQILEFMSRWEGDAPVVIVPTMYPTVPVQDFEAAGVSLVIWANHLVRASIGAMQQTATAIHDSRSLMPVEGEIVSVKEIFRLQGADELKAAEARYLPG